MVAPAILLFALATAASSNALPLTKRIAQVISDSTAQWEKACTAAGGADKCNPVSVTAFSTLLAAAGPCDQQNAADSMVDLAKTLNNDADMIRFAQIFAQQPRNTPDSFSVPYCQQAPKNAELNGLFQCQFQGVKDTFVGNLQPGAQGTIPFGLNVPVNPSGSCPAHTSGGIADGTQLVDLVQDPGVGSSGNSGNDGGNGTDSGNGGDDNNGDDSGSDSGDNGNDSGSDGDGGNDSGSDSGDVPSTEAIPSATSSADISSATPPASSSDGAPSFALQNGQDAQQLNAQFQALTADSPCQEGDMGCVSGSFAQCVGGKFVLQACGAAGSGLTCAALPLVNKPGTTITCTTESDALARIAATGATGGFTGVSN